MGKIQSSIDVNVPISTAYNQWTQFEEFPEFMEGVDTVRQIDDKTLEWHADVAGNDETWTAEIYEQEPDERVSWRSTSGAPNSGTVSFDRLGESSTRVTLTMDWRPEGAVQQLGDSLGFDDRRVRGDLERFKEFIEARGQETGAWRGQIKSGSVSS
jgi:uncharacterized membrane protein